MFIFLQTLRKTLDVRGFHHVKIVAADSMPVSDETIIRDLKHDPELFKAVDIVGFV